MSVWTWIAAELVIAWFALALAIISQALDEEN